MTVNIVMLVHNRPRLTLQCLNSLLRATDPLSYCLTIVDDGSEWATVKAMEDWLGKQVLYSFAHKGVNSDLTISYHRLKQGPLGPGTARNIGVGESENRFGRRDWLYLADNDGYYLPGWLNKLTEVAAQAEKEGFKGVGAYCHPFNQPVEGQKCPKGLVERQAVGFLSFLMRWDTWSKYGPLAPSPSINNSEDWLFCQQIRRDGGRVGSLSPEPVINCGLTGSTGRPSPGAELLLWQDLPEGVIIE